MASLVDLSSIKHHTPRDDIGSLKWGSLSRCSPRRSPDLVIKPRGDVGISDAYSNESTGAPSRFSQLPVEISLYLLNTISTSFDHDSRTTTLWALSLTSRVWSRLASVELYRHPHLFTTEQPSSRRSPFTRFEQFCRMIDTQQDLADTVRELPLGEWAPHLRRQAKFDRRQASRMSVELVKRCHNVQSLNFPGVVMLDRGDLYSALFGLKNLSTLSLGQGLSTAEDPWVVHLDAMLQEHWASARWSVAEIGSLIDSWPNLKHIRLNARLMERTTGNPDTTPKPWTCQLESFEFDLIKNARVSFAYLDRLLLGSSHSLRRLRVCEHQLEAHELARLIETYGPNLTTLETTTSDLHQRSTLLDTITSSCHHLEHLVLGSPVDPREALEALSTLSNLKSVSLEVGHLDRAVLSSSYRSLLSFIFIMTTDALTKCSTLQSLQMTWRTTGVSGFDAGEVQEMDLSDSLVTTQQGTGPLVKIKIIHL
ncbi:hypothetical protein OIO90_001519 [Microbotryomycetes sp. JL221]|nr:hypothetical protein OIO90_001519 [Microbotryomycetes sp. JL221]